MTDNTSHSYYVQNKTERFNNFKDGNVEIKELALSPTWTLTDVIRSI